ncbi:hypothetical protein DYB32_001367 [Aphanomyces invadans]|uniref:ribonuclease Z n=1 Tax=Aphanomyces invadans TaxID=157072 RepID=A0A418B6S2_9STRA|nr:hypothetical protein DYB32_001367 [Aphanomyces invadans]
MLEWLKAFYEAKDPSKVPYVQVILNKYQGRQDDLKRMLVTKYGSLAPESSSDDSSEDDEDVEPPRVNEDSTSSSKNSTPNVNVHSKDDSDTPHTKEAFKGSPNTIAWVLCKTILTSSTVVGTFGQLWRQFGPSTPSRLCSLKCIWVSHKHADHHCGLLRVLLERHRAFAHSRMPVAPIVIIAPDAVLAYVARWQAAWLTGVSMVSCTDFNHPQHALRPMVLHLTGFLNMWSVPVHHCHDSYGLVLVTRAGMKLVYSGDTRPCDRLIHEGFRPHVLIHEATFEDSMHDDAIRKKHSTVGEALNVGRRMQAHLVLLTHFSQRYPKLPPRQATGGEGSCGFAFDGMQVILDAPDPDPYHPQYLQPSLPPPGSVHSRDSIEVTLASFMSAVRNEATAAIASPPSP